MNQVRKNFVYQILYRGITILTPLITSPILARALGAEKLGLFSATLAFVSYFQLISMLGVENYGNRSIAAVQDDLMKQQELFWNIYAVQVSSGMLAILLYCLSFIFISNDRYVISLLQGLWLIGSLLNINWYFFGTEQFKLTVTRNIIVKLLTVALIVLLVRKPDDIYVYVLIMAGDTVLSNLLIWPFLKKSIRFQKPEFKQMRKHIKPILVLFVPILAMSVFHIMDKTMLDWLGTETDVGYYYSADKIINIPLSIITALSTVMMPRVSNEYSKDNQKGIRNLLRKSTELTLFLTCAVGFGIAAIANEFVPWFFGKGFEPCIQLVYWFVPILFAKSIGDLIRTQYMIPAKLDKLYTIAVIAGACVNLIANYTLIQVLGCLGAVLGTLMAELTVTILELNFTRNQILFGEYIRDNCSYLIPSAVMLFLVRYLSRLLRLPVALQLLCMVGGGGLTYLIISTVVWQLKKDSIFRELLNYKTQRM